MAELLPAGPAPEALKNLLFSLNISKNTVKGAANKNLAADMGAAPRRARLALSGRAGNGCRDGSVIVAGISPFQRVDSRVPKAARDLFLVVVALALFGSQALSTLHYALVPHHLCATHGVLEDGSASVTASATEHDAPPQGITAEEGESDVHGECSVATRTEHGALLERPAAESTRLDDAFVATASAGVFLARNRAALLSSAPKTSPPLRA